MSDSQHTIAGTVLTMPVRVRKADVHTAMFSVPADAAQRLCRLQRLKVCEFRPGRAVVNLMLARYIDGDLGKYNEFGTCVMVNPPGSNARGLKALGDAAAFHPPPAVDLSFTLEAGPHHLGLPQDSWPTSTCARPIRSLSTSVKRIADRRNRVSPGPADPVAAPAHPGAQDVHVRRRHHFREVPWEMKNSGVRFPARAVPHCGSATTRTPKSWPRWACRSARWCRDRSPTST